MISNSTLFQSFKHAFKGLFYAVSRERNLQLEILAAFMVVIAMFIVQVERWEAVALVISIFTVLILETINTLVERLVNIFRPRIHPYARIIKDVMAASVLLASLGAAAVGIIIFWPYFF